MIARWYRIRQIKVALAHQTMLIDKYLPNFHFRETHSIQISAPAEKVLAAALAYSPSQDIFFRIAIGIREFPMRAIARLRNVPPALSRSFDLENFTLLEKSPVDVTYGMAGRFWQADYGQSSITDDDAFCGFNEPGNAKLVLGFTVTTLGDSLTLLSTETRIQCLGDAALNRFRLYWYLIRPVSGIIRMRMLQRIRNDMKLAAAAL